MSILLKVVAGVFSGVVVALLAFAFWPHIEPAVVSSRPAVAQPVFVTAAIAPAAAIDRIALALRAGPQGTDAAAPTRGLALTPIDAGKADVSDETLRLRAEGLAALAGGDFAGARALLERAAEAGDARALLVLGDAYDPATLARMGALGLKGDAQRARDYYTRALAAGVRAARQRIAALAAQQD
jgi:TPR repeat protein